MGGKSVIFFQAGRSRESGLSSFLEVNLLFLNFFILFFLNSVFLVIGIRKRKQGFLVRERERGGGSRQHSTEVLLAKTWRRDQHNCLFAMLLVIMRYGKNLEARIEWGPKR